MDEGKKGTTVLDRTRSCRMDENQLQDLAISWVTKNEAGDTKIQISDEVWTGWGPHSVCKERAIKKGNGIR